MDVLEEIGLLPIQQYNPETQNNTKLREIKTNIQAMFTIKMLEIQGNHLSTIQRNLEIN
jgi:hypothetical protein